jgi:hypothetical protein
MSSLKKKLNIDYGKMQSTIFLFLIFHFICAHDEVHSIQHYVMQFVSNFRQVGGFLRVLRFPPPIKMTTRV